eukprot:TRINITY_DN6240_c0_g1_i1.p1 TRINITY_DN6240_c0_g1~~TRINITY_DN6240_c0_g1_i1.p1  ORF type:complete len:557 (+),score=87.44 TRINITY_DN6240_c0_g1_i1:66-1736(+)
MASSSSLKRARPGEEGGGGHLLGISNAVKAKIDLVAESASSAKFRSDACQVMLDCMVRGSASLGLDQRDSLQERALDIVGEVIEDIQEDVDINLKRQRRLVSDPEKATAEIHKLVRLAEEDAASFEEKARGKEVALERAEDALEQSQEVLAAALQTTADLGKFHEEKLQLHEAFGNAYQKHFLPLKAAEFRSESDADAHASFLMKIFKILDVEDTLLAAFEIASTRPPHDRSSFDNITMDEAEDRFLGHMDQVKTEAADLELAIANTTQTEDAAAWDVLTAEKAMRNAGLEYGKALADCKVAKAKEAEACKIAQSFPKSLQDARERLDLAEKRNEDFKKRPCAAYESLKNRIGVLEDRGCDSSTLGYYIGRNICEGTRLDPRQTLLSIHFGFDQLSGDGVELHASAIVLNDEGVHDFNAISSSRKTYPGIKHIGKSTFSACDECSECIEINLAELCQDARQIYFALSIFTEKHSFAELSACQFRVADKLSGRELVNFHCDLMEQRRGLIIARLYRDNGQQWYSQKIGLFSNARTWCKMMPELFQVRSYLADIKTEF